MPEITMSIVDEILDPKLKEVAKRVFTTFRLAAEKAVLNYSDEANYPIPADPNSVEQLFRKQFTREGYREETRQAALEKVKRHHPLNPTPRETRDRNLIYGDLANVNLRLASPVVDQVHALAIPADRTFSLEYINSLDLHGGIMRTTLSCPSGAIGGLIPQQTPTKLEFRAKQVRCIDETNGFLNSEWGDDEIDLGGIAVDAQGEKEIPQYRVGEFNDGDVVDYTPPKVLTSFDLTAGAPWGAGNTGASQGDSGYRLVHIGGYTVGNGARYTGIWEERGA